MKSLSLPCIAEQLAKLDQWQCHSVHTRPSSHTHSSFARSFHTDVEAVTLPSLSDKNTQHVYQQRVDSLSPTLAHSEA